MSELRHDLPPGMPDRMKKLPVSDRGYPVPWFVEWLPHQGAEESSPVGVGYPEFRFMRKGSREEARLQNRCWICGDPLGKYVSFVVGPMCAMNKTSAEPPSHRDCGEWAAIACPFLVKPKMERRQDNIVRGDAPGQLLERNPGVAMVWTTTGYKIYGDTKGSYLFEFDDPTDVRWFAEGREATREEILESIESGYPLLADSFNPELNEEQLAEAKEWLENRRIEVERDLVPA